MHATEAAKLISRLSRTAKYPEEKTELRHCAEVLIEASSGDAYRAEAIVEEIRRTCEFFPPDAVFFQVAERLSASKVSDWKPKRTVGCIECQDSGRTVRLVRGYECSVPCGCAAGRKVANLRPQEVA